MTDRQYKYLRDLINKHPNFKKETHWNGIHQDVNGIRHYTIDGEIMGGEDEVQTTWVNAKYGEQFLDHLINSIHDLDNEQASALITHLQLRK